ncbi:MAG: hypothetical protein Q9168_001501 [Polycauliona sp. 1 TL-2023]
METQQQKRPCPSEPETGTKELQELPDVKPFFSYDQIVKIFVGPELECFEIHRNLVSQYPFFKAAFEGSFQESEGVLRLPEQHPEVVRFFIHWLYSGKLTGYYYPSSTTPSVSDLRRAAEAELQRKGLPPLGTPAGFKIVGDKDSAARDLYELACDRDTPFNSLVGLYLLAEYLQIPCLKDIIINTLVDVYGYCSNQHQGYQTTFFNWSDSDRPEWASNPIPYINAAWNFLPENSNLCRFLVTLLCDVGMNEVPEQYKGLDSGFLCAAFVQLEIRWVNAASTTKWLEPGVLCKYHDHDGTPCRFHERAVRVVKKKP